MARGYCMSHYHAVRRAEARDNGKCINCFIRNVEPGYVQCSVCRESIRASGEKRRRTAKAGGNCIRCFNRTAEPGHAVCASCLAALRQNNLDACNKAKLSGLCTACRKQPAREDGAMCTGCLEKMSVANAKRNADRHARGVCIRCETPTNGTWRCSRCAREVRVRQEAVALKPQLVEAYDGRCHWCGERLPDDSTKWDAHHLWPVARGGDSQLSNLAPVHRLCHAKAEAVSRLQYPATS